MKNVLLFAPVKILILVAIFTLEALYQGRAEVGGCHSSTLFAEAVGNFMPCAVKVYRAIIVCRYFGEDLNYICLLYVVINYLQSIPSVNFSCHTPHPLSKALRHATALYCLNISSVHGHTLFYLVDIGEI